MMSHTWLTATPDQIARSDELARKWQREADDPLVAIGAAMALLMTVISQAVPPEYHEASIEAVDRALRRML